MFSPAAQGGCRRAGALALARARIEDAATQARIDHTKVTP
jgi:hypothetical protein